MSVANLYRVAIMQPTYLPWCGYFNMIKNVDEFVFLDSVQFNKRSWQQRNRIEGEGSERWLTVPVYLESGRDTLIQDVKIADAKLVSGHYDIIKQRYSKTPYWNDLSDIIDPIYSSEIEFLSKLNTRLIIDICKALSINTKFSYSSDLNLSSSKGNLIFDIAENKEADVYVSAPGSREYLDESNVFGAGKIKLEYFEQSPLEYPQSGDVFSPYLSIIDLIANVGIAEASNSLYMELS